MQIRELTLKTSVIRELYDFYGGILNFEIDEPSEKNKLIINAGNSVLIFETCAGDVKPLYHFAFNIPSNKIEEAREWLKGRVELIWLPDYESHVADFSGWHAKSLYFLDPAGNIVEFISRFDLNDMGRTPFSELQIRNISELGVVFPKSAYREGVEELLAHHGMSWFNKQEPQEHFCALGDDQGLFIVVPESRSWYPTTDCPASLSPLKVKYLVGGKLFSFQQ
jgi:catechol 2,3-dioxygenase-like lactoylglutathione lyase family enzyme